MDDDYVEENNAIPKRGRTRENFVKATHDAPAPKARKGRARNGTATPTPANSPTMDPREVFARLPINHPAREHFLGRRDTSSRLAPFVADISYPKKPQNPQEDKSMVFKSPGYLELTTECIEFLNLEHTFALEMMKEDKFGNVVDMVAKWWYMEQEAREKEGEMITVMMRREMD